MKGGLKAQGFTIVEVMIVLIVTSALFISAAALIAGKQNQTEFDQSIRQIQAQIQQTANEVAAGFYPNAKTFNCTASASGPVITSGSNEQGTNTGCIFLGKVMQFQVAGTNPEQYAVHSIAGLQKDASGNDITSLTSAKPISVPGAITTQTMQYGLTTKWMKYNGATNVGSVGFISCFNQCTSTLASGAQQVDVVPVTASTLNASTASATANINSQLGSSPVDPGSVTICFASGSTNQSGLITIGSNDRQLSVTLAIKGNTTCS